MRSLDKLNNEVGDAVRSQQFVGPGWPRLPTHNVHACCGLVMFCSSLVAELTSAHDLTVKQVPLHRWDNEYC